MNARNATLILGAFLAGQFCFAAIVGFVYGFNFPNGKLKIAAEHPNFATVFPEIADAKAPV